MTITPAGQPADPDDRSSGVGAPETRAHQSGAHATGAHQTGAHATGAHEEGAQESGAGRETGAHETGAHEVGAEGPRRSVPELLAALAADPPASAAPAELDATAPLQRLIPAPATPGQPPAQPVGPEAGHDAGEQPVLVAHGLGLRTSAGWTFREVDLVAPPGTVQVLAGPSGSGRSSLLLALTGRMAHTAGSLAVAGSSDPAVIRQHTAVARISRLIDTEEKLTVRESVDERCLIDGVRAAEGRRRFAEVAALLGLQAPAERLAGDLPAPAATLLTVALACVRPSQLIVLDDLDRGIAVADQRDILVALKDLAAQGPVIVVATADPSAADRLDLTVTPLVSHALDDIEEVEQPFPAATSATSEDPR